MNWLSTTWQDLPANTQDVIVFFAYLLPVILLGFFLFFRLSPATMIKTLLKRYRKINLLIVVILGVCLAISLAIGATTSAYKTAMAAVANRFELVVTAPGSKTDMMLSTVYLQPVSAPLLGGDIYEKIAHDNSVAVTAPIAYGDSYHGFPVVGSTNSFIKYLSENQVSGDYFTQRNQAIVGGGVDLNIGDRFVPQHGIHKSFAPQYTAVTAPDDNATASAGDSNVHLIHEKAGERYFCPDGNESQTEASVLAKVTAPNKRPAVSTLLNTEGAKQPRAEQTTETTKAKAGHHNVTITVVGKMPQTDSPWDKAIITPVESVWAIHGLPTGHPPGSDVLGEPFDMDYFSGTPAILVHPKKRFQAYPLSKKYTTSQSMAFMPPTVLAELNAQLDDMTDILSGVALLMIVLVLSLAIVTIALLGKLFEKHFQLLKSLGSPKRFVVAILWGYVTTLAGTATALGCLLGYLLTVALSAYIEGRLAVLLHVQFGWVEFTLCALFFALTSLLGLIPALNTFRKKRV